MRRPRSLPHALRLARRCRLHGRSHKLCAGRQYIHWTEWLTVVNQKRGQTTAGWDYIDVCPFSFSLTITLCFGVCA